MAHETIIDQVLKLGSVSGLISLIYLIFQNLRKRPRFKLDFQSGSGTHYDNEGVHFYRFSSVGILKNQSLDPNTVTHLHLAVWGNKKKTSTLRFGYGGVKIIDKTSDQELKLPIQFSPREARRLNIVFEFPVQGTADEKILQEHMEIKPGSGLYRPRYEYEICVEDVAENVFDSSGKQINREEINLRWTLPNTVRELQQGKIWPFIRHYWRITLSNMSFRAKVLMQALGLWR
ncbi:hypothetical protein [Mangrovitalea sediminis]|uniref:hypothetical protein n=1 Tax=Mangrovitalea sediminis TaxID=1982043 RepID=UPI000BE4FE26|nr:hypothetical protein [Mangrovitalea sediminis]